MNIVYSNTTHPPYQYHDRGIVISSLKKIFILMDNFPSKEPYMVDWKQYFMRYDWCWMSLKVQKQLKDHPLIGQSFLSWEGKNYAQKDNCHDLKNPSSKDI